MAHIEVILLKNNSEGAKVMVLNTEKWMDFNRILQEFGYELDEKEESLENKKFLWEIIINIRKNMKEELEEAIRVNLQLCYLLEEEEQTRAINSPLFKLNYIFEQDFYRLDNDSIKGLCDFHKLLISTYGKINIFLNELKEIKENLYFIRKRYDQVLVEKYNYLRKISLPLRGYEELRFALLTLLKKFAELSIIIRNPKAYQELLDEVDTFIEHYREQYLKEHNNFHQKLKEFYSELYSLPEYRVLDDLSHINVIKVAYNLRPIKKYIETFFPEECKIENVDEVLEKQVKCSCGFNMGQNLTIPSLNKIKPMLRKGISEYLEQLHNKRFRALFENYLSYKPDSCLKKLMEIPPGQINGNLKFINQELINEINEALSNTFPLKISFDEIATQLAGTYSVSQLDLLGKGLESVLRKIIRNKMVGMAEINYDEIVINLIK
jgi:hypothetical protein